MAYRLESDKHIYLKFHSPFQEKVLLTRCEGQEFISDLFRFNIEMVSPSSDLSFSEILGKNVTIEYDNGQQKRYFNGIISEFRQGVTQLQKTHFQKTFYYATVVPQLWLAKVTENCKIFQHKTTLDIVKEILKKHDVKVEDKVQGAGSESLVFCVQYNESDFNFISRLMEKNGIFYFFKHENGKHTMVLGNSDISYPACEHNEKIKYTGLYPNHTPFIYGISRLEVAYQVVSSGAATNDFNFTMSKTLYAHAKHEKSLGGNIYHYPGQYPRHNKAKGEEIAKLRLKALDASHIMMGGDSNVSFLMAGCHFTLEAFPRHTLNGKSLVLHEVSHFIELQEDIMDESLFEKDQDFSDILYKNSFRCLPKSTPFHPPLKTPQPKILSIQTAIVTGPEGEEIWTNKYGEIKVKFHWDLSSEDNDKTSCWIRVAQGWAGNNWGILFTPRIGQEVVVQFLNGNPDDPLITGCVYNSKHMPPYLPGEPTKSTIKTHSTKHGSPEEYNELRFEDKKGEEQIYLQAQKNLKELIKNDMDTKVIHNKTSTIVKGYEKKTLEDGDRFVTVHGNQITHITKDMITTVDGNMITKVKKNFILEVEGDVIIKVKGTTLGEFQSAIVIKNKEGGIATTVQQGAILTTIMTGDMTTNLVEGSVLTSVETGDYSVNVIEGAITTSVELGDISTNVALGNASLTVELGAIEMAAAAGDCCIAATAVEVVAEADFAITGAAGEIVVTPPPVPLLLKGKPVKVKQKG